MNPAPSSEPLFEPDSDLVTGPLVEGAPEEPVLAVDAVQGVVLPGFATPFQQLAGVRFTDADGGRRWLGRWSATVSSLADVLAGRNGRRRARRAGVPPEETPVWTGLALSAGGLRLFGVDPEAIGDPAFAVGMWPRSGLLGDPVGSDGDRRGWVVGGTEESTPHVLVILGGPTGEALDERLAALAADPDGVVGFTQRGEVLDGEREHFGFRDGVSAVGVRGRLSAAARHFLVRRWIDPADERARTLARPGQPLVWPGQFVFGYPRQDRTDELRPLQPHAVPAWVADGSLLAFRRLRQDVPVFRAFTDAESARLRAIAGFSVWTQDRFEAALVGRWPDGSALMRTGGEPDPTAMDDLLAANHFNYGTAVDPVRVAADPQVAHEALEALPEELRTVAGAPADPDGERCPLFAHVRKVNPRDRTTDQGGREATLPTQVLRRGITWGSPYVPGEPDDRPDRGLLFMCWQTSLEDQFELLTARWMNQDRRPEVLAVSGHDLLVGQAPARRCAFRGEGGVTRPVTATDRWVVPTGGGYFFGPSLPTLRSLAEGRELV